MAALASSSVRYASGKLCSRSTKVPLLRCSGVNAVSQRLVADAPQMWQSDERAFVQGDIEGIPKRVVIWGMDAGATSRAVDAFVGEGLLDLLLDRIWRFKPVAIV